MNDLYLNAIKNFEGYTAVAKWDYAQHSVGFGTKAAYPGEVISPQVAEQRFREEIGRARAIVEKHASDWDEGTKAALTSLTFNAGTRWISSGLGDAVRDGDINALKEKFVQYVRAGGETLPGLVKRRETEASWIGSSQGSGSATPAVADAGNSKPAQLAPVHERGIQDLAAIEAAVFRDRGLPAMQTDLQTLSYDFGSKTTSLALDSLSFASLVELLLDKVTPDTVKSRDEEPARTA